jgi:hypothetical protein
MVTAEAFVQELEEKNQNQAKNLLGNYADLLGRENLAPADLLRLEQKSIVEALEVAALWLADSDSLDAKLAFASQCGDGARHFRSITDRLAELGLQPAMYDARFGGYSKLFAFFRSLQTVEERLAASPVTLKQIAARRFALVAEHCARLGDVETGRLFSEELAAGEQRHIDAGRQGLVNVATTEESQARARRASFRTIELLGEVYEPSLVRKFLSRSLKK